MYPSLLTMWSFGKANSCLLVTGRQKMELARTAGPHPVHPQLEGLIQSIYNTSVNILVNLGSQPSPPCKQCYVYLQQMCPRTSTSSELQLSPIHATRKIQVKASFLFSLPNPPRNLNNLFSFPFYSRLVC